MTGYVLKRERLVSFTLFINFLITVMNSSMFTVAIPEIAQDFKISPTLAAWMVTSYSVCFAISALLYGRLTVYFSIPTLLSFGLTLLGIGSILGMITNSYPLLVFTRIIQALGTSSVSALGILMISKYFPVDSKNRALALISSASVLGFGLGPLVGGLVTEYFGWNYLFTVSLISVFGLPIYSRYLPRSTIGSGQFDIVGFALFGMSIISLILTVSSRNLWFLLGFLFFPIFLKYIQKVQHPFLSPLMLRDRIYQKTLLLGFSIFFLHFGILFITPLLLTNLHGESVSAIGWIIFIGALGSSCLMRILGNYVDNIGLPIIVGLSTVCMTVSTFLYSGYSDRNAFLISLFFFISSTGFSCITMGLSNFMTRYLAEDQLTTGYGALQLIQFFGGAFGVAVVGGLLESNLMKQTALNIFWLKEGEVYSNAYLILLFMALFAFCVFLSFYFKTQKIFLIQKDTKGSKQSIN